VTDGIDARALIVQWFAEQGFAVLVADGSGTPGHGPAWEREVYGDLFGPVLDDQVAALHEAARLYPDPDLDLTRVGTRAWSFSGSLAALAVLRRPDVFHAAVAGAGVTDQVLYEAHWRERFLGHPAEHPERYQACSLLPDAPGLTRPLLLIHGLADDEVHVANALRLSAALLAAGPPHEVASVRAPCYLTCRPIRRSGGTVCYRATAAPVRIMSTAPSGRGLGLRSPVRARVNRSGPPSAG
jgi:dipeptidyl-peptidase-4